MARREASKDGDGIGGMFGRMYTYRRICDVVLEESEG